MQTISTVKESFALAGCDIDAREKVIAQTLVFGTEDWYYYRGLVLLQKLSTALSGTVTIRSPTEQENDLLKELKQHLNDYKHCSFNAPRYTELETRFYLLTWFINTDNSKRFVQNSLRLNLPKFQDHGQNNDNNPFPTYQQTLEVPQQQTFDTATKKTYPSCLDTSLLDRDRLIRQHLNNNQLDELNVKAFPLLQTYWPQLTTDQQTKILKGLLLTPVSTQDAVAIPITSYLITLWRPYANSNSSTALAENVMKIPLWNLTLDQLDELQTSMPVLLQVGAFVNAYMEKLVPDAYLQNGGEYVAGTQDWWNEWEDDNVEADGHSTWDSYLMALDGFADKLVDGPFRSVKARITYQKLRSDILRGSFDESLLLAYLFQSQSKVYSFAASTPMPTRSFSSSSSSSSLFGAKAETTSIKIPLLGYCDVSDNERTKVIGQYITGLIRTQKLESWEALGRYLDHRTFLEPLQAKVMLTSGLAKKEDIAGWSKMLGRTTFTNLTNETILTFGPATLHNARNIKLTQDDTIKVHVTIKNIPRLTLRIFPIDLFNYWKLHPHDCTIKDGNKLNVDGLCPIYEHQLDYSNVPPLQLINETFIFGKGGDSNDGKPIASELFLDRGAWMIDFIGGQNQCRAIVQKGYLRHLIQNSAAGHIFFILDENNQPLMDVCSIWFENSSYKADESGNILIPYRSKDVKKVRALLVTKTGYCQPIEFYHQAERYSLHASFYLNYESLVPTKRAKVIITPSIKLQDQVLPLQLLNKLSLQIVTTNTNGIKSSISIINLKSVKGKPLECEFIVPKALASIQLTLKAKVKTMSKEQSWKHLEFTREIHSKSLNQDEITTTQLRANTSGYFVCVVGKNGEPHKRHVLDLSFKHILTHKEIDVTMQTDENGHITLGALDQVESVAIKQLGREWNLLADNWKSIGNQDEVALPSAIHYYANTEFEIPFAMREGCKCTLFKTGHQTITIADYTMRLKYTDSTVIVVGGLPEGSYRFYLSRPHVRHDTLIEVTIVKDNRTRQNPTIERKKGDLWNDWMINNRIYGKISGDVIKQPLGIDNITITDSSLTLKLNNATTTKYPTFAVITTSVFLPPLPDSLYNSQIRNAKNTRPSIKNMNRNGMEHIYLSGRKLGEEYQYILNRAKEDKYVGSTLTEPSLLVNPKKNRSTTIRSRVTGKGNRGFTSETKQKNSTAALLDGGAYGFHHGKNSSSYTQFGFEYLNNRTKALVLQVNDQGEVEIDRSRLGDGNLLQVIILSGDQVIGRTLVLPDVDLTMKLSDQRQTDQDLDVNAPYLRNKLITVLSPSHPQHTMEIDQTQHESEIVDSQEGLFDIFKLLAPHQSKELADFDILRQWGIWNDEEKLKAHDKMNSHELNLWIKYKDTSYFENNIKPFIKDKIDKTFMDDYLIDADLTRYANDLYLFQQLNVAEKALLAKRVPQALPTVLQIFKDNYTRNLSDQPFDTVLAGNSLAIPVPEHSTGFGLKSHFPRPPPPPPPPQASGAFGATQSSESFVSSNTPGTFGSSQSFGGFGSGPQPRPTLQSMPATGFGSAAPQAAISLFGAPAPPGAQAPAVAFGSAAVVQSSAATPPPTVDARNKMDTKSTGADIEGNTFYDEDNAINDEITEVDTVIALRNQAAKRHQSQQPYEYMGRTSEWEEQEYYDTAPGLINVNQFWIDYLENELDVFVSANAIYATSSIAEMIFALALLDLPIKPDVNYDVSSDLATGKIFLSAQTPLIVFYRSLKKYIQPVVPTPTLLLGQHIFERNKNSINSSGEEHIVDPAHLLLQTPYGWHLAISNISTKAVVCEVTLQIPTGAVPLGETPYCQSKNIMIQPYTTWHEVVGSFYFPEQGTFHQFPVTLGKQQNDRPQYNNDIDEINGPSTTNMILLNQTQPLVLTVNEIDEQKQLHESTSTAPLTTYASWSVITSTGTTDDILNFIENHSDKLKDLDWSLVKWRMTNPSFARSLLTLLATRKHYVNSIYAYGIYHGFNDIIADLLVQERFSLLQKTGITFDCHLVKWRAYGNHYQKVLDYYPISNARAHPLGSSHEIANEEFFKHYDTFLTYLNQSVQRTSNDYLILSIYLIIHGRIGEAQQAYTQSQQTSNEDDDGNRATTVQTDYLGAYLATRIKVGDKMDWSTVKKMVAKYKTCGSLRWRNLFAQLNDLVMQAEKSDHQDTGSSGFGMATVNKTSLGTDPVFDFTIKDNQVVVRYANLTEMQVRFYTINVEVMFSNQPFLNKANKMSNYGWVQANHVETINLLDEQPYDKVVMMDNADDDDDFGWIGISKVKQRRHILPIPLVGNLLVEIHAHGKTQCQTHYNHALTVHLSEQNGLARVLSTVSLEHHQQKPLSGVYVKVYAKLDNGCVEFWKDGYTGLTGVFDYISVTHGNALAGPANLEQVVKKVRKFALLFSSETYGAVVKEAGTPV